MHPEESDPFAAPTPLAELALDRLPLAHGALTISRTDLRVVVQVADSRPRVVTALMAAARFLSERGIACTAEATPDGSAWSLDDADAIRSAAVLAAAIQRAGDAGFSVLGAWAAACLDREAVIAASARAASPAVASPFTTIGEPTTVDMPPATATARYAITLEEWGPQPERTEALLHTVLGADTPEALSEHRAAGTPLVVVPDASARDVRRVLVAVAVPTRSTFRWTPRT
jgi:hypothetical protein